MVNIPSTMRAVVIHEVGGRERLQYTESHPVPQPEAGELLVKNEIAGVNFIDIYYRTGHYPAARPFSLVLGAEAIGTVAAITGPNPHGFHIGDRVLWSAMGAYAEYTAVPGDKAIKVQSHIFSEDAVGSYVNGMTALTLTEQAYSAGEGETVLVHAAAGGVGLMLCQLLEARGVTVIGTASDEAKFALAKANGATHMINYKATSGPSWVEQVKELTNGHGVNAVFDSVGKDTWEGSFEVTKNRGKVIFIGSASGPVPPVDLSKYSRRGNISILLSALANSLDTREALEVSAARVQDLIVQGKLKVHKHKTYELQDAAQAHEDLEGRLTTGKLFLAI